MCQALWPTLDKFLELIRVSFFWRKALDFFKHTSGCLTSATLERFKLSGASEDPNDRYSVP